MPREFIRHWSMNKILLDSTSYFRLADNLYPLLSREFGKGTKYKFTILGGTMYEYYYNPKLQTKFEWICNDRHKEDRYKLKLKLKKPLKKEINNTKQIMMETCIEQKLDCSNFDTHCLATAYELAIPIDTRALKELSARSQRRLHKGCSPSIFLVSSLPYKYF